MSIFFPEWSTKSTYNDANGIKHQHGGKVLATIDISPDNIALAKAANAYAQNKAQKPPFVPITTKNMPWRELESRRDNSLDWDGENPVLSALAFLKEKILENSQFCGIQEHWDFAKSKRPRWLIIDSTSRVPKKNL